MQKSAMCANDHQTFWPFTTKRPSSSVRAVRTPAQSEPLGSEKPWHQISSAERRGGRRLLLLGAVRDDRRAGHADPDHAGAAAPRHAPSPRGRSPDACTARLRRRSPRPRSPMARLEERPAPLTHLRPFEAGRATPVALQLRGGAPRATRGARLGTRPRRVAESIGAILDGSMAPIGVRMRDLARPGCYTDLTEPRAAVASVVYAMRIAARPCRTRLSVAPRKGRLALSRRSRRPSPIRRFAVVSPMTQSPPTALSSA